MDKEKFIDVDTKSKEKIEVLKRKANVIKEIAVDGTLEQLADVRTYQFAAGIGLYQGLKYRGSVSQGFKAGLASIVVFTGANILVKVVNNFDDIKNA